MLGERIKDLRKGKLTQAELAEKISVHEMTVRRWENTDRQPTADDLKKLAQALNTSVGYLLGETDDPKRYTTILGDSSELDGNKRPVAPVLPQRGPSLLGGRYLPESNVRPIRGETVEVPVLAPQSSVCCGKGFNLAEVEAEVDWWEPIPEAWLTGTKGDKPFFITHVEGDSMEPMIMDGERILINPNQEVVHGDVALVCWNGRSVVRGVKLERNGDVRLVPANKDYDEDVVSKDDAPYVLSFGGVVVRALGKDRLVRGIL